MAKIHLEEFSFRYTNQRDQALEEVSLSVEEGELLGIVGKTGAGKTTLLSAISGIIPFNVDGGRSGMVYIDGSPIEEYASLQNLSSKVSMVLETPENQLFNLHVYDEIIWGLENHGFNNDEIAERADRALDLFGLEEFGDRITYNLSGGEKQKVAIASIYAMGPEIMLLDEPTSQLDPIGTEMVFDAVDQLVEEGITIVMAEHKINELAEYADRIALLNDGRVERVDSTRSFLLDAAELSAVDPPQVTELGMRLADDGLNCSPPVTLDEAIPEFQPMLSNSLHDD